LSYIQSFADEPAVIDLLRQQYNIDRDVRLLQSFMVCTFTMWLGSQLKAICIASYNVVILDLI